MRSTTLLRTFVILSAILLVGCSESSDDKKGSDRSGSIAVTGSLFAAPVAGAQCEVSSTGNGSALAEFTTDSSGEYSVELPTGDLSGMIGFACAGGTFTDEATGGDTDAGALSLLVDESALSEGAQAHITPATTILAYLMQEHGITPAGAEALFEGAFGYAPDTALMPVDATNPAEGATAEQLLAGLRIAAFSQLTQQLGLAPEHQFGLLAALAQDLSDGALNGEDGSGTVTILGAGAPLPRDIQNQFAVALIAFLESESNATGLGADAIGTPPFGTVAVGATYAVEYLAGGMGAVAGKTTFQLRITDADNGDGVNGVSVTLMPMMHMAAHNHSTPVDGCVDSGSGGIYDCTLYYLMASSMNGVAMGYWDLQVNVGGMGGDVLHFYPTVGMAMGDTAQARLKGQADMVGGMMGPEKRTYYLFKSGLSGMTGNHTFALFIAAKESMMSFPAVDGATVLNAGGGDYELNITTMLVEVSTDGSTWISAGDDGNGYWSATGLTGLTNGATGSIYVRLSINGEQKTTDGNAASGANGYATFAVTPGGSM
jgi:hypothetical protein